MDSAHPPVNFDALVSDILENPEILFKQDLTSEQILEIQKRLNPYAGIAGTGTTGERKRIAAVSYTNLREDYLRRLTMTSLVGFLFQVQQEWEVPSEYRHWTPVEPTATTEPFVGTALVERLETLLALARDTTTVTAAAADAKRAAIELDLIATPEQRQTVARRYAEASALEEKAAGLLYVTTHLVHRAGLEAGTRLKVTADVGMKYSTVKEVLDKYPLPLPPGELEIPQATAKAIINVFLTNWLRFDPSVHVRSGHDAKIIAATVAEIQIGDTTVQVDSADPNHLTLDAVRRAAPIPLPEHKDAFATITTTKRSYDAVVELLRDEDLADAAMTAIEASEHFRQYLLPVTKSSPARPAADNVPPQDTFHRWTYYTEVNYEELRTITEVLYPERPDLDWAIAVWDMFEGTDEEVNAAFEKYCQRYADEVPSSIKALEFGSWSLLADFKENRKKIQFYNKNTEVLKRILDRHSEDKRMGAELMRNRVRHTKARNIATDGPDAPGLAQYKRAVAERGQDLTSKGVEKVISPEEMRRLEKAKGSIKAAQELELLEQLEKTIRDLSELEKLRPLTEEETRDITHARSYIEQVREMVAVPDDTVQVDVFTSDPSTGGFSKSHFYTKADPKEAPATSRVNVPATMYQ